MGGAINQAMTKRGRDAADDDGGAAIVPPKRPKGNAEAEAAAGDTGGPRKAIEDGVRDIRALTARIPQLLQAIVNARAAEYGARNGDGDQSGALKSEEISAAVRSVNLVAMTLKKAARTTAFETDALLGCLTSKFGKRRQGSGGFPRASLCHLLSIVKRALLSGALFRTFAAQGRWLCSWWFLRV